ncbi:MAG: YebC/PmpR family DNA-binding transcriptional regulator [Candidatus Eiseniibacteriota bacterium]
MSGHSKWATIKRKKAATDQARGKVFSRVIKEITLAARSGGGNPDANIRLRQAVDAAKAANMPAANIERAIQRGTGELEGVSIEEITYEGYAPGGVAILVDAATDNRNRTAGEIRNVFSKFGGNMGEAGCVSWMFEPRGVIEVERGKATDDQILDWALEAGAEDVDFSGETVEVRTAVPAFDAVKKGLSARGLTIANAELTKAPSSTIELDEKGAAGVLKLFDALENHDDVQKVYANFQIHDEVLSRLMQ